MDSLKTPTSEGGPIEDALFETLADGRKVTRWDLRGEDGSGPVILDLGATILALAVPDRDGEMADVVLGFDTAAPYLTDSPYFGAVIGRFANRIANGRFTLEGVDHALTINDAPNALHGGAVGWDKRVWKGARVATHEGTGVRFTLVSADGEEGFPGEVTVSTTYVWTPDHRLVIDFAAATTRATPFNITQHSFWNLGGVTDPASVLGHWLAIDADRYTPVTSALIPTGELADVAGTPFDFRTAKPIGRHIAEAHPQIDRGNGYDHNLVLNGRGFRAVAVLAEPASGRRMVVSTDQPGLQVYSGNVLDGIIRGKGGVAYPHRSGLALETQHFPDSPNQPAFPDTILRPGKPFHSRTVFAFDTVAAGAPTGGDLPWPERATGSPP